LTALESGKAAATSGSRTTATVRPFSRAAYGFFFALEKSKTYSVRRPSDTSRTALLALFIISTLAPGDFPSSYQTQSTLSVGERHENQARLRGMAYEDRTGL
jgi:hypothetical protein